MGLFFTLLYILTAYLSPPVLFGPLAEFHLELVIAAAALVTSLPVLPGRHVFRQPQMLAIAGMCFAVFMSRLFTGWMLSAPLGLWAFFPNVFVYLLVVLHCRSRRDMELLAYMLFFASSYIILRGSLALYGGELHSPFLLDQGSDEGTHIFRLRGLAIINDPNDFSQAMVALIPCIFFSWRQRSFLRNTICVLVPVAILIYGIYMTHSRGAMLALLAVIGFSLRRKVGNIIAGASAVGLFAVASALSWTGGRQISADSGSDRLDAWYTGLNLFRMRPIFGVGFLGFGEYNYITAHNSVVVCAAELGFVGLFFWVLFLYTTARNGIALTQLGLESTAEANDFEEASTYGQAAAVYTQPVKPIEVKPDNPWLPQSSEFSEQSTELPVSEIRSLAMLVLTSLVGFLVAGWFLSRAYVMWLFIFAALMQVVVQIAADQNQSLPRPKFGQLFRMSAVIAVGLLAVIEVILKVRGFLPG